MRKLAMGLALASTALASPALAKEGQWYIGVDAGAMIVDSASVDGTDISVDHDEGYDFGAVVGHDFGAFRLETEVA
ncbi:MAG: flagellar motor protein MotB, partial [Altererythrobacter sp.]|nr:flagellar motor protein MotB [Altererythrobacter sp.]